MRKKRGAGITDEEFALLKGSIGNSGELRVHKYVDLAGITMKENIKYSLKYL
ncbi:MAG TPA: hypothetical protein GX717_06780 [Clostridiaceae bacterium]|jgi:hypothetical protein|nr:hypothetical protein [Clostridiaceae bacterium]